MSNSKKIFVRDVMGDRIEIVDGMLTVLDGVKLAQEKKLRALLIDKRHDHDEWGIVMLADIAKKVVAKDRSPKRVNLYEVMTKPVLKVEANMDIRYCARLFDRFGIHSAPVFEGEELKGIISYTDIIVKGILTDDIED